MPCADDHHPWIISRLVVMWLSKNVVIFDSPQIPLLAANTQVMITVKLIQIFLKHLKEKIFSLSAVDWSDG